MEKQRNQNQIVALPFSRLAKSVPRVKRGYVSNPQTVGHHLRNKRITLKLEQKEVASLLGFKYKTYLFWENSSITPENKYFPKIIEFLGYNPLQIDTTTMSGKIKLCCIVNGLTRQQLSKMLGIAVLTLSRIESGATRSAKAEAQIAQMLSRI